MLSSQGTELVEKRIRKYTIIISIILHLIFFLTLEKTIDFRLLGTKDIPKIINDPIIFDLTEDKKPKQVIETTENQRSKKRPKKADYLSDKNTSAKNPNIAEKLDKTDPYSKGDINIPTLPKIMNNKTPNNKKKRIDQRKTRDKKIVKENDNSLSDNIEEFSASKKNNPAKSIRNSILHKNILSKVKELGGFAFNTYDWDFAPYMLELKRRVQSNIFPPIAFSRLGIISGETLLQFRIYPDGRLEALKVLDSKGHKSLVDTSVGAVEVSAPFPALPDDFPEPFLEITGKFIYFVKKYERK